MAGRPEVAGFVEACREFTNQPDGQDGAFHLARINRATTEQMPREYQVPFPDTLSVQPVTQENQDRHLRGLWHELVQHLTDLGYLTEADFIFYHEHRKEILETPAYLTQVVAAVGYYLEEEKDAPAIDEIRPDRGDLDLFWVSQHLGTVTEQISRYLAWEGQLPYPADYRIGDKSCYGRSLAYRLRALSSSQHPFTPRNWLTAKDLPDLENFFSLGFNINSGRATEKGAFPAAWWSVLSEIDLLLKVYLQNTPSRDTSALLYQLPPLAGRLQVSLENLEDKDLRSPEFDPQYYDRKTARQLIRGARRRQNRLDDGLDIRLLQVKLWQTSYYVGAIDGEWGQKSHDALKSLIAEKVEQIPGRETSKEKRKMRSLLLPANVQNRVYAADLKQIIKVFNDEKPMGRASTLDNPDQLNKLVEDAGITYQQLDEKVLQQREVQPLYPDVLANTNRRVSFPRKALLPRIWSGIKKVVRWLKNKIVDFVEALLGPVFSFVKHLLRNVRMAIQRFFTGFKYLANLLFGRPVVTEVAAADPAAPPVQFATRFAPDFDGTTYAPPSFAAGGGLLHAAHLRRMHQDMFYFIDSVIFIIKAIGKLSNPGGWVWLGWQILRGEKRKT